MRVFDNNDPYCLGLIEDQSRNQHKLVLTNEDWGPNWYLPNDDRARMFVRVGPFLLPGRGYSTGAGWGVYVCGAGNAEMRLDLIGEGMEPLAKHIYRMITDFCTRGEMRTWSMR